MSATVRARYKQTAVGEIPVDWHVELLGRIGQWYSGGTPSLSNELYWSGDIPWVSPKDMKLPRLSDAIDHISPKAVADGARVLPVGAVLMVIRGMILAHSFPVARVESPLAFNQDIKAVVPRSDIDSNYVLYWLMAHKQYLRGLITESTHGTKRLPTEALFRQEFCVPPLPEQRAIATALSDVDALLAKLDALVAKKRNLKQAAMQQLLTGRTRLPGFSGKWDVKRLGALGDCLRGVTYKGDSDLWPHDTVATKRLLRSNNVQNAKVVIEDIQFVNSERVAVHQQLRGEDILICMANGSKSLVGKAALFTVNDGYVYTFGAFMACFRTNTVVSSPSFIFYLFQTGRYKNFINNLLAGSSINNLSPGSIESLEFPIPSMPEQAAIASILADMDAELVALEARRDKTRAVKQGMMQELVTGRMRLV